MPQFWSKAMDAAGHTVLTYAVRGGRAGALLVALGAACFLGAARRAASKAATAAAWPR